MTYVICLSIGCLSSTYEKWTEIEAETKEKAIMRN